MRPFNICTISTKALGDLSGSLRQALQELGYTAHYSPACVAIDATNIFLDSSLIADWSAVPAGSILYNLEQLGSGSHLVTEAYLAALSHHQVWDYSLKNIEFLKSIGVNSVRHVPIGYSSALVREIPQNEQDIDILFYGWINDRRAAVLDKLKEFSNVAAVTGVYGAELLSLLSRAKLVLNLHFYDTNIFESVRVSFLLANKKAVVSEVNDDTEFPSHYQGTLCAATYQDIPEACQRLLANVSERETLEQNAFRIFSSQPQSAFLSEAILAES